MSVISKFIEKNSCNAIHPWNESCLSTFFTMYGISAIEAFKIYTTLYTVSALIFKRKSFKIFSLLKNILRSTVFLSLNGSLFIYAICFIRKFIKFNKLTLVFMPSFLTSMISIIIENKSRRQQLAVYMANNAIQTTYMMLRQRGYVNDIRYGEIIVFSLASSAIMHLYVNKEVPPYLNSLLSKIVGKSECSIYDSPEPISLETNGNQDDIETDHLLVKSRSIFDRISSISTDILKLMPQFKSIHCVHKFGCIPYFTEGFLKMFAIGGAIQLVITAVKNARHLSRIRTFLQRLFSLDNLQFPMFLGTFAGIFRFVQCLQRFYFGKASGLMSGLCAGLSKLFYPSTYLSMYIFSKSLETLAQHYLAGVQSLVKIKHEIIVLIYSLATAIVFHAALVEPHNIPISYYKFSDRMTGGKIHAIDRS